MVGFERPYRDHQDSACRAYRQRAERLCCREYVNRRFIDDYLGD